MTTDDRLAVVERLLRLALGALPASIIRDLIIRYFAIVDKIDATKKDE